MISVRACRVKAMELSIVEDVEKARARVREAEERSDMALAEMERKHMQRLQSESE